MTEPIHVQQLRALGACDESIEYALKFETAQAAWDACERIDWLTWLLRRLARGGRGSAGHRQAVLLACLIARTVTHLLPEDVREESAGILSEIEGWAWGESQAPQKTLLALRQRCWEIRSNAADAAAAAAATAYAYAAAAAAATAYAYAAADAAVDAYAYRAAWSAARREHILDLCALVRSAIPCPKLEAR